MPNCCSRNFLKICEKKKDNNEVPRRLLGRSLLGLVRTAAITFIEGRKDQLMGSDDCPNRL